MAQKVTVTIPRDSGLPADNTVNTFWFRTGLAEGVFTSGEADTVADVLARFYNDPSPGGPATAVRNYMASVHGDELIIKFYDHDTVLPAGTQRIPYQTRERVLGAKSTSTMPEEVALCLSYRAALESGTNPARRRGRIFIGPLGENAVQTISDGRTRPPAELQNALIYGAQELQLGIRNIGANFDWGVYSPTDNAFNVIAHAWVDDAFDTMRSRGPAPSGRLELSF